MNLWGFGGTVASSNVCFLSEGVQKQAFGSECARDARNAKRLWLRILPRQSGGCENWKAMERAGRQKYAVTRAFLLSSLALISGREVEGW